MRGMTISVALGLFVAMLAINCYAAATGPIKPLGSMKYEISAEYNGVIDRDLDKSGDVIGGEIEECNQGYLKMALGLGEMYNVYGKLGIANLEEKINWNNANNHNLAFDYGFLWGVGGNGLFSFENNFGIGADVQFDMWFTEADSVSGDSSPTFINKGSLNNYEFQTSLYLTYTYEGDNYTIVPYSGGYYSYFKAEKDDTTRYQDNGGNIYTVGDIEGDDNFGVLIGLNLLTAGNWSANVEGRFIAETAVTGGISYKF